MSYDKIIKQQYENKYNFIQANLMKKDSLFPSTKDRKKSLDMGKTLILQLIFELKVGFLEEFTTIFSFAYSKHTFENLILSLEEEGWIKSMNSKSLGKYFILSDNALYFIYCGEGDESSRGRVTSDTFPNEKKLQAYKIHNGIVARHVLTRMLDLVDKKFHELEKEERTTYTKSQFLLNFVYPQVKSSTTFSSKDALDFLPDALENLAKDEELTLRYRKYVKEMKLALASNEMKDLQIKFCFYKDFANKVLAPRDNSLRILRIVLSFSNNLLRTNPFTFYGELYKHSNQAKGIKMDFQRFYNEELLRNYTIVKRNLGNTKSGEEGELNQTLGNIEDLAKAIQKCEEHKNQFTKLFECMSFKNYNEQDIPTFEEKEINLDVLKKNACYIIDINTVQGQKPLLTFAIIDDALDELATPLLFKRLEYIYLYYRNHLLAFDFEMELYTYRKSNVPILREKLRFIIQQFKDIGEYGLFTPKLMELSIISSEVHPNERFQVMQAFQKEHKF